MNYKIATIHVSGTRAVAVDVNTITKGIAGAVVEFFYDDPLWDGLIKNVVFEGSDSAAVENAGNIVEFPAQVAMAENVPVRVSICGLGASGETIIPTLKADLGTVRPSAYGHFPPPAEHELPVWAQIQTGVAELTDRVDKLERNGTGGGPGPDSSQNVNYGNGLKLENGVLSVNTTDQMEQDNTLPITSAGVFATVGNIEALLATI